MFCYTKYVHYPIKQTLHINHASKYSSALVYFFATTTPLFMLPQAIEIFQRHKAENVALLTWLFFLIADIVWISYGIKHKLKPLVYCHILYFVVEATIVIGILKYKYM